MRFTTACAVLLGAALVSGCSSETTDSPVPAPTSAPAVSTESSPASQQPAFAHPCDIPDATLSAAGIDPSTRKHADSTMNGQFYSICQFPNSGTGLFSGAATLDAVRVEPKGVARDATVNTRPALVIEMEGGCRVALKTTGGIFMVGVESFLEPVCDRAERIATALEPVVGR